MVGLTDYVFKCRRRRLRSVIELVRLENTEGFAQRETQRGVVRRIMPSNDALKFIIQRNDEI